MRRRSSGNTNDLRGKILCIRLMKMAAIAFRRVTCTLKEWKVIENRKIYVQETEIHYRISVDQKNRLPGWGEVGPDARADSLGKGSKGIRRGAIQGKKACFFWLAIPCSDQATVTVPIIFDFQANQAIQFDPLSPVNINSRIDYGLREIATGPTSFHIYYSPTINRKSSPQFGTAEECGHGRVPIY